MQTKLEIYRELINKLVSDLKETLLAFGDLDNKNISLQEMIFIIQTSAIHFVGDITLGVSSKSVKKDKIRIHLDRAVKQFEEIINTNLEDVLEKADKESE